MGRFDQGNRLFNPGVASTTAIAIPGQRVGITPTSTYTTKEPVNPVIGQLQTLFKSGIEAAVSVDRANQRA